MVEVMMVEVMIALAAVMTPPRLGATRRRSWGR
jgi:hypothetical protein